MFDRTSKTPTKATVTAISINQYILHVKSLQSGAAGNSRFLIEYEGMSVAECVQVAERLAAVLGLDIAKRDWHLPSNDDVKTVRELAERLERRNNLRKPVFAEEIVA